MRFQKMSWTLITLFLQCELYGASDADYIGSLRNVELIKQGPLYSRSPDDQAGPLYVVKSIEGQVWWLGSPDRQDMSTCVLDDCITPVLIRGTLKSNITYKKQDEKETWIPSDLKEGFTTSRSRKSLELYLVSSSEGGENLGNFTGCDFNQPE